MSKPERFTNATGAPVLDNTNILTAGRRGPALLQDIWLIEKLAHFDREVAARAINGASQEILERHVANCRRADPAYGDGVARALKLNVLTAA
jgi:catalase